MALLPASKLCLLQTAPVVWAPLGHAPVPEGPAAWGCRPILSAGERLTQMPTGNCDEATCENPGEEVSYQPRTHGPGNLPCESHSSDLNPFHSVTIY